LTLLKKGVSKSREKRGRVGQRGRTTEPSQDVRRKRRWGGALQRTKDEGMNGSQGNNTGRKKKWGGRKCPKNALPSPREWGGGGGCVQFLSLFCRRIGLKTGKK